MRLVSLGQPTCPLTSEACTQRRWQELECHWQGNDSSGHPAGVHPALRSQLGNRPWPKHTETIFLEQFMNSIGSYCIWNRLKWIQIGTVASGPRCWCQAFSNSSNSCAFFARHRQARRRTAKSCPEPRNGHQRNHRQCVFERIPSDTTQTHHDEIASKEQRYFLFRPQVKGVKRHVGHVWARIPGFLYAPCMHAMSSVINNCWMMTPSRCQVTRKSIQETASLINVHP